MKIIGLTPCLMQDNNRFENLKSREYSKKYNLDEYIVYDQCFQQSDYTDEDVYKYIGHKTERMGFVTPRNELLKYFYNSDADYAFWFDANSRTTDTTLNDVKTVVEALRSSSIDVDVIFSTLGIWCSEERIRAKKKEDYKDVVRLIPCLKGYNWMHGLFIKNFKKYYNDEYYIDTRCDPKVGTAEDVYFARLLRNVYTCWLCPTIVISKPSNLSSTWVSDKVGYDYPPVDYAKVDEYISELHITNRSHKKVLIPNEIVIPRIEEYKDKLKDYVSKKKEEVNLSPYTKNSIW